VSLLVLEDGRVFTGEAYGAEGETIGEAVFCTAMTGYQEILTDPSYHRQVVVMTSPHVGNTGVNDSDDESDRIWVAGYVVRDPARVPSSWRAKGSLQDRLAGEGVVGISGVDTRALTRHLRERGAMRVGVSTTEVDARALLARVRAAPVMTGSALAAEVSTRQAYTVAAVGPALARVVALDLGIKSMTPHRLAEHGIETRVLPATATVDELVATEPDGVFFSNGPGDPATADHEITLLREVLHRRIPFFGICFGHQLFGLALGLSTYKLDYGHRGVNQPVLDLCTGRVEVTAHNHGFAVGEQGQSAVGERGQSAVGMRDGAVNEGVTFETEFGNAEVTHVCLNDGVIEGLRLVDQPAISVQYHPEAAAGPHDAGHLFDRFLDLLHPTRPTQRGYSARASAGRVGKGEVG